jgi:hypothetical protein
MFVGALAVLLWVLRPSWVGGSVVGRGLGFGEGIGSVVVVLGAGKAGRLAAVVAAGVLRRFVVGAGRGSGVAAVGAGGFEPVVLGFGSSSVRRVRMVRRPVGFRFERGSSWVRCLRRVRWGDPVRRFRK